MQLQFLRRVVLAPLLLLALCLTGCTAAKTDLDTLTVYMTGTFSSASQAKADPEFRDITLHMAEIWPSSSSDTVRWLYVEQAVAQSSSKPYRQRIYKLNLLDDGTLRSDVYTLPAPLDRFIGGAQNTAVFAQLTADQLTLREGCSITLRRTEAGQISSAAAAAAPAGWTRDGAFLGSTSGSSCASELQGAKYATSEAIITPQGLRTWDRGFDASGKQVWGATTGGYEFARLTAIIPTAK